MKVYVVSINIDKTPYFEIVRAFGAKESAVLYIEFQSRLSAHVGRIFKIHETDLIPTPGSQPNSRDDSVRSFSL